MKKKPDHVTYNIFAATIPIMEDGPLAAPTPARITILAEDIEQARQLGGEAGLTVLGQVMNDGRVEP